MTAERIPLGLALWNSLVTAERIPLGLAPCQDVPAPRLHKHTADTGTVFTIVR
ncbi:MAG: hypothetical protein V2J65_06345 [Desulfobacteraceae bacterium]|nr:hypothetical protein [Desulfobacteraceae bacterium]